MKRLILIFIAGFATALLLAFTSASSIINAASAEVNQIDGLYVFTDCTPVAPYDSLGLVTIGFITGTQYENIRRSLIKQVKKKYPDANGLLFRPDKKGVDSAVAIILKKNSQ